MEKQSGSSELGFTIALYHVVGEVRHADLVLAYNRALLEARRAER